MRPAIQIKNLNVTYGSIKVIDDFSCEVKENSVTAIIGPSGCGKSTLLRCLCRMNDHIENFHLTGKVLVKGEDIYHPDVDVYKLRKRVGLIYQKPCVFPKSIFQNVLFGVKHMKEIDKKDYSAIAERVLKEVNLWEEVKDRLNNLATTLSMGQQQRLAMARTLAVEPEILLMDEPTSSLDPESTAIIESLIQKLKTHRTLLLVTHQPKQAEKVSDNLIFCNIIK
ncbi:MAG: phosphate ABC transporter ATP-binding protein [Nitrospina sp.]|jgi:phosphate transport system ATP-binding protein|nr:phosphate ABC transporter ATP-binding protein [Nitrospina sp.]MBT6718573.1 phosphate ABC transporter ATP-binding protein [Nitrospina sp.]